MKKHIYNNIQKVIMNFFLTNLVIFTSPASNQNYVLTVTSIDTNGKNRQELDAYDGLGKKYENVRVSFSPSGYDLASIVDHDALGRIEKSWLPTPIIDNNNTLPRGECWPKSMVTIEEFGNDTYRFITNSQDITSTPRYNSITGPGRWHTDSKNKSSKLVLNTGQSSANNNYKCIKFTCNAESRSLTKAGYYDPNTLTINENKDEDGNISYTFINPLNQKVLERTNNNGICFDTYYIYDSYNNLCFVLSPMASKEFSLSSFTGTVNLNNNDILKKFAYYYNYDSHDRCIEKKLPGISSIYFVYDKADRLRFSQDGNQRAIGKWIFYKYDIDGRQIQMGIYKPTTVTARDQLQSLVNSQTQLYESPSTSSDYYTCNTLPTTNYTVLLVNFYDKYDFYTASNTSTYLKTGIKQMAAANSLMSSLLSSTSKANYGELTAQRISKLAGTGYYWKAYFHDGFHADPVFIVSEDGSSDGLSFPNIQEFQMDLTGQITSKKIYHNYNTALPTYLYTEYYTYLYDNGGRLTQIKHHIDTNSDVVILENTYNELGQLSSQKCGNGVNTQNFTYNICGWQTSNSGKFYSDKSYYETGKNGETGYFNGNLFQSTINTPSYNNFTTNNYTNLEQTGTTDNYTYSYDQLNRLTSRLSNQGIEHFGETYEYDLNGNITYLRRGGIFEQEIGNNSLEKSFETIDNLFYSYNGNQINLIIEFGDENGNINNPYYFQSQNFVNTNNYSQDYTYDENGNITSDMNKNIVTIKYNLLNKPDTIQYQNGMMLTYIWDACGEKRSVKRHSVTTSNVSIPIGKTIMTTPGTITITGYTQELFALNTIFSKTESESFILRNSSKLLLPNGIMLRPRNSFSFSPKSSFTYNYYVKDYLGSIRAVIDQNGTLCQASNYYPSGMEQGEFALLLGRDYQNYQFGGKEIEKFGSLFLYDFGARMYDATVSRWLGVDPLAEKYYSISPYAYCAGNPVSRIDPDGMDWFQNAQTGAVAYASDLHQGAEKGMENGWEWMGVNNMFMKDKYDIANSDQILAAKNGGKINIKENNPLTHADDEWVTSLSLCGDKAAEFMSDRGYEFKPTQQIRYENEINFEQASGTHVITGEKTYITEKSGYLPKGSIENRYTPLNDGRYNLPATVNRFKIEYTTNIIVKGLNLIMPYIGLHDMRIPTVYPSLSTYPRNNKLINLFLRTNPTATK